jgi:hypothetical protein
VRLVFKTFILKEKIVLNFFVFAIALCTSVFWLVIACEVFKPRWNVWWVALVNLSVQTVAVIFCVAIFLLSGCASEFNHDLYSVQLLDSAHMTDPNKFVPLKLETMMERSGRVHLLHPDNKKPPETKPARLDCCSNCTFAEFESATAENGACHSDPPQLIATPSQDRITGGVVINIQSFFPMVARIAWCGNFKAAIKENSLVV